VDVVSRDHIISERVSGTLTYTFAGRGEPMLLVHGFGGTRHTWRHPMGTLARTRTVIAPDLPGHGDSAAPAGAYSLGAHATALRDLLVSLGLTSATIIGHSLGGGIALQFAYQFPERTDRLVLISSGGLGPQLTPALRADSLHDLTDARRRRMAWGSDDKTIPPHHHESIAAASPGFHTAQIADAGHYPHETAPGRLVPAVQAFLRTTRPFRYGEASWRNVIDPTAA